MLVLVSVGSKFWHNCKCGPLGPKNAGGRAQCLCWGTARSDRAANHALAPTTCSEHGVPKCDAPEHALEHGLFRSKKMLFLPAPEQKNTVFACSGALFEGLYISAVSFFAGSAGIQLIEIGNRGIQKVCWHCWYLIFDTYRYLKKFINYFYFYF